VSVDRDAKRLTDTSVNEDVEVAVLEIFDLLVSEQNNRRELSYVDAGLTEACSGDTLRSTLSYRAGGRATEPDREVGLA
jgi:hypothetical protein